MGKRWNHYVCKVCGGITVARHDDEGVTPFVIACRAKDERTARTVIRNRCQGFAKSVFFMCSQADDQQPHVIFYRPAPHEAVKAINKMPRRVRTDMLEHYERGGSLLREVR